MVHLDLPLFLELVLLLLMVLSPDQLLVILVMPPGPLALEQFILETLPWISLLAILQQRVQNLLFSMSVEQATQPLLFQHKMVLGLRSILTVLALSNLPERILLLLVEQQRE